MDINHGIHFLTAKICHTGIIIFVLELFHHAKTTVFFTKNSHFLPKNNNLIANKRKQFSLFTLITA